MQAMSINNQAGRRKAFTSPEQGVPHRKNARGRPREG